MMKYDLHMHTSFSCCSAMKPINLLRNVYKTDLDGIAITDHNTIKGALEVVKLNKQGTRELDIIVGSEIKTDLGDVLVYYQNEEIKERNFFEVVDKAKEQGALVSIAHPFRLVPWHNFDFKNLKEILKKIDAIETFNSRTLLLPNYRAKRFADKFDLAGTGGSDAHFYFDIGRGYTVFDGSLSSALKKRKTVTSGSIMLGWFSGILGCAKRRVIYPIFKV